MSVAAESTVPVLPLHQPGDHTATDILFRDEDGVEEDDDCSSYSGIMSVSSTDEEDRLPQPPRPYAFGSELKDWTQEEIEIRHELLEDHRHESFHIRTALYVQHHRVRSEMAKRKQVSNVISSIKLDAI